MFSSHSHPSRAQKVQKPTHGAQPLSSQDKFSLFQHLFSFPLILKISLTDRLFVPSCNESHAQGIVRLLHHVIVSQYC